MPASTPRDPSSAGTRFPARTSKRDDHECEQIRGAVDDEHAGRADRGDEHTCERRPNHER